MVEQYKKKGGLCLHPLPKRFHYYDIDTFFITESDPSHPSQAKTSSTTAIIPVVTSIASIIVLIIILCGVSVITIVLKRSLSKTELTAEVHCPSNIQVVPDPIYESIFPMEFHEQDLELKENIAYEQILKKDTHGH